MLAPLEFYDRGHFSRRAREIDAKRDSELKEYPFPDVLFITAYGLQPDIPRYTPKEIQSAREKNPCFQFFKYWQKYCATLEGMHRALAAYEGAIWLVAECLPDEKTGDFRQKHQESLLELRRYLSPTTETGTKSSYSKDESPHIAPDSPRDPPETSEERPAKKRRVEACNGQNTPTQCQGEMPYDQNTPALYGQRGTSSVQQLYFKPPAGEFAPMTVADWDELDRICNVSLKMGVRKSGVRNSERGRKLTETVCLFWPPAKGDDFILDLVVSRSYAESIKLARVSDTLKEMMGDFLFNAQKGVTVHDIGDNDAILRIVLGHRQGWETSRIFPVTDTVNFPCIPI